MDFLNLYHITDWVILPATQAGDVSNFLYQSLFVDCLACCSFAFLWLQELVLVLFIRVIIIMFLHFLTSFLPMMLLMMMMTMMLLLSLSSKSVKVVALLRGLGIVVCTIVLCCTCLGFLFNVNKLDSR